MSAGASGVVDRDELAAYLDALLDARNGDDYGPNGLQVEGRPAIAKLVTGVTACRELLAQARERGADAVLVHHGLFWRNQSPLLVGGMMGRVRELVEGGLSLFAYHLPLDRHPTLGNNALGARELGLVDLEPFAPHHGLPIGARGRFPEPIALAELLDRCRRVFQREPLHVGGGPDPVRTLGLVTGGGQGELHAAIALDLDAFVTGEASEWVTHVAREAGIHFLAAGHHATERSGVEALGRHLRDRFGIAVEMIDVPNPI